MALIDYADIRLVNSVARFLREKLTLTISPGCCIALYISNLLREEGEIIDKLIMLDASPAHFLLPVVQQGIRKGIIDGGLQDEVGMNDFVFW